MILYRFYCGEDDRNVTQEERNQESLNQIMEAAIREFGKYGYRESSINRICKNGNISKGKLYHYFSDKEALFHASVFKTYREFTDFMSRYRPEPVATIEQNFHDFFYRRQYFFLQNPYYPTVMFSALSWFNPPEDPSGKVAECTREYYRCMDQLIHNIFALYSDDLLSDIDLAAEVVRVSINRIQFDYGYPDWDPENPSEELLASNLNRFDRLIHLLLYGVMKRG